MAMTEINPKKVTSEEMEALRVLVYETLPAGPLQEALGYIYCGLELGHTMYVSTEE